MEIYRLTEKCIAYGCDNEAHSGSSFCYYHLPGSPLFEAKERLNLMKLEQEALENYANSLREDAEDLEQQTKEAFEEADKIKSIAEHKATQVKKLELEVNRLSN